MQQNIRSERQYQITKHWIEQFRMELLAQPDAQADQRSNIDPLIRQAMRDALQSQIDEMSDAMVAWESRQ
jgi:hypothetical protein